ncbi:DUF58 domain-containing protein [Arthrobacter roseus]|uniref:DUF58 domain-containing protein n=1 Tax=Arthrobacter roseus TaxID=136274 RepID=UPI001965316E|nr:DUF58 domain-containing protein [Arthrobacter roseus]MBM7849036.1 uncharacterized protein (DUF58 family) [Arthrobacter roseus]
MAAEPGPRRLNGSWGTAVITGLVCLLVGTVSGRPDVAVLAAPFILLAVAGLQNLSLSTRIEPEINNASPEGQQAHVHFHSPWSGTIGVVTVAVPGTRPTGLLIPDSAKPPVVVADRPLSGRSTILTYTYSDLCPLGLTTQQPQAGVPLTQTVLPRVSLLGSLPLPPRLTGRTGAHTSRLPGTGTEFRGLYPFAPGDDLRRIDWRATARQADDRHQLIVRGAHAESEAILTLVVDTAAEYPMETDHWFGGTSGPLTEPSSLHLARSGATAVAASYLAHGDRVGLSELSGLTKPLRALAGRRQLDLLRARLAQYTARPRSERTKREQQIPSASLVIVFSPFMDDDPADQMLRWHRLGHRVIGIDTLPHLRHTTADRHEQTAVRLSLLQRTISIRELHLAGITVLGNRGENSSTGAVSADPGPDSIPGQLDLVTGLAMLRKNIAKAHGSTTWRTR